MDGAYAVGLDPLYEFTVTSSSSAFGCQPYECKKAKELNSEITLKYKIIEEILLSSVSTSWQWIEYFLLQNQEYYFQKLLEEAQQLIISLSSREQKKKVLFVLGFLAQ